MSHPGPSYPSRSNPEWGVIERREPVVWGDGDGPLGAADLALYRDNGFILLEGLLSGAELARLRERSDQMRASVASAVGTDEQRDDIILEPDGDSVRSIFRIHETDDDFAALVADPRMLGVARQVLGSDVYIHHSRLNYKPALDGREFFWHSDFETWHIEDGMPAMRALTAVVMLDDNIEFNGPMLLIPGSHKLFVQCVGETPDDHFRESLRKQRYGVPGREALTALVTRGGLTSAKGVAGSVLFFDCNTMHASSGNLSPYPRCNAFFVYNSVDNPLQAPYGGKPPRPDFLARRDAPVRAIEPT